MAHLIWSPRALNDMEQILAFISRDSEYYARVVGQRIISTAEFIERNPSLGSMVSEYNMPDLRERIVQNYRVVYRVCSEHTELVTICHAARLLQLGEFE